VGSGRISIFSQFLPVVLHPAIRATELSGTPFRSEFFVAFQAFHGLSVTDEKIIASKNRLCYYFCMDERLRKYMSELGKKGGKKSRRKLTKEQATAMARKSWKSPKRQK
jgi:hypothetical protein